MCCSSSFGPITVYAVVCSSTSTSAARTRTTYGVRRSASRPAKLLGLLQRVGHAETVELGHDDGIAVGPRDLVGRVDAHLELPEALLQRVVREQPADERIAEVEDELDRLHRLDRADDAGKDAEHAGL